jgi:uncharacterized protein
MAVVLACPNCNTALDTPAASVGRAVPCPKCATPVPLPATLVPMAAIIEAPGTKPSVPLAWSLDDDRPLDNDEKTWGLMAHLGGLLANFIFGPFLGFLPPVLILVFKGKDSEFVTHHAKEALNFQITVGILQVLSSLVLGPLIVSAVVVGFMVESTTTKIAFISLAGGTGILTTLIELYCIFLSILACIRSYHGAWYRYPHCIRFVK